MRQMEDKSNIELTEEQQEFIRLLREKAADTPIPMALQPEMMMARLPEKPTLWQRLRLRIPSWKTVSGMAAVMAAFVAVLMTGREPIQEYLKRNGPAVTPPEVIIQSEPSEVSEPDNGLEPSLPSDTTEPAEDPSSVSEPESSSEPAVSSEQSPEDNITVSRAEPGTYTPAESGDSPSRPAAEPSSEALSKPADTASNEVIPSGELNETSTVLVDPSAQATNLPSGEGADYADVYAALQRSVTPENATTQYATAVLSAGISADGLMQSNQKTLVATDGTYFYVSRQNATSVSILRGSESSSDEIGRIDVRFETPSFDGMEVTSTAITGCYYSNGELFVVGTISYSGSKGARTLSAVSCYDVSTPKSPRLLASTAQDGTMVGAVMSGSYLYLFSRYYPDTTVQESYPAGYIPLLYGDGLAALPSADCISISEAGTDSYIVATSRSVKNPGDVIDCKILQGCGKSYFLGEAGLYLFQDQSNEMKTMISGITFSAGQLHTTNDVTVNGILGTLEAPNEYGSTLRILTSSYGETNDTNLYIFDRSLNLLGKAESFLEDAVLRSVRFDGNTLYYTIYGFDGQVYELNLSDPANLRRAETAAPEEEALISVSTEGNYSVRLTGRKGRTELVLTLRLTGLERDSAVIPMPGGYNEEDLSLTYLKDGYVCLTYREGINDVYKLYHCEGDTLTELLTYGCPSSENGKGYLQDGRFFLVTSLRTLSFSLEDGELLTEIYNEG